VSDWERTKKNVIVYKVTVPANCTATLSLPEKALLKKTVVNGEGEIVLNHSDNGYSLPAGKYIMSINQ
jgi:hemin uptake protein HemP